MIFIAGISIALFIASLLFVKKDKAKADIFLFLWMVLISIHLTIFYLHFTEIIYDYPYLLGWKFPLPLLHGVMLYYYVSSVTNQFPQNKLIAYAHLTPPILTIIYLIPFVLLPAEQKIEVFKNEGKGYESFMQITLIATFISGVVYVIWSSILLNFHKKRIRDEFSNIEDINLNWLRFIIIGLGIVWSIVIFTQDSTLIFTGVSVFAILIGFFGIQQKNIFAANELDINDEETKEKGKEAPPSKEKYSNSGLSEEKANIYNEKLNKIMVQEKVYTNIELSLSDLASKLEIHPNYLSEIINKKENKTFYDYINQYRVEEFKRLVAIPDNQQFTLMALAYDCGFNSKSSFNRHFKRVTNQTPSQYVKVIKAS